MVILSPNIIRISLIFALISIHMSYLRLVNTTVPTPYLDEIFHIPQAQSFWSGDFVHWDDKITTPPATYFWSYLFSLLRRKRPGKGGLDFSYDALTVEDLRFSNAVLSYVLLLLMYVWAAMARRPADGEAVLQRELVVVVSPLLWFFSTLYYTDLWSAVTVLATCAVWETGSRLESRAVKFICQALHVVVGLVSLASRQTNVFWVAVFLGGLQVVRTIEARINTPAAKDGKVLKDPEVGEVCLEDIPTFISQLIPAAITHLPAIIIDLWPNLTLLAAFGAFVKWNGGVVLGDKSNHVATIHTPQLLYIWPCIVFFSWPALLPLLANLRLSPLTPRLPRAWLVALILAAMIAAVHYNTIVHPFTLADNRHYVFYVFRILTRSWWIKYAAIPVYFVCGWLVLNALSGGVPGSGDEVGSVGMSFVLVWFLSTALSLISAPLVEPRYFIVPWLIWRLYVPEFSENSSRMDNRRSVEKSGGAEALARAEPRNLFDRCLVMLARNSLWIELAWYLAVNYATCWMFLFRGFQWTQQPGLIQRFMW